VEAPSNIDKCLAILVLRRAGCSQDDVSSIMHCAKSRVGEVEKWFSTEISYSMAVEVCSEAAIKEVISLDIITSDEVHKGLLQKVERITPGVILRHYRQDHLIRPRFQEIKDLAIQLHSSISNISAKDWSIWGLPDTGYPPQTSEAGLKLWMDRGELVVKLSVEMDHLHPLFMARMKASFSEFGYYDRWRKSLDRLVYMCCALAAEIRSKAKDETNLLLDNPPGAVLSFNVSTWGAGETGGLSGTPPAIRESYLDNVSKYIYEFAVDNFASEKQPNLEILQEQSGNCWLVPADAHNYHLAMGSLDEMEKCREATVSLAARYANDERIGKIVAGARKVRKDAVPYITALSSIIEEAADGS